MAKKIKPGAEEDEGTGVEIHDSDKTEPSDYDIKMKQLRCRKLELLCLQLEIDNRESAHERQQRRRIDASEHQQRLTIDASEHKRRRRIGLVAAVVAGAVPVLAVGILFVMLIACPEYFFKEMNFAILFVASFSSMTVIYAFLIRGMFPGVIQKNDTSSSHPVADEAMKVARSALAGKE